MIENNSTNYSEIVVSNITQAMLQYARIASAFENTPVQTFDSIIPLCSALKGIAEEASTVKMLSEEQILITHWIPYDFIKRLGHEELDSLSKELLEKQEAANDLFSRCSLDKNRLFCESVQAFNNNQYSLAVVGFTAVLDHVISISSGLINSTNFKDRCNKIFKRIEANNHNAIENMLETDYYLLAYYSKVITEFSKHYKFTENEPSQLNRNWISHGNSQRFYSKLDCIKIANMILATIRLGQLSQTNSQ